MSYNLYILHVEVFALVEEGWELSEIEQPQLEEQDVAQLLERIPDLGYELVGEDDDSQRYMKDVEGCPIRLDVFGTEITLKVPQWEACASATDEAIQDAAELAGVDSLVVYDPQTDEWLE